MAAATESIKNWLHGLTGDRTAFAEIADERDHHIEALIRMQKELADSATKRGDKHSARLHWHQVAHYTGCRRPEIVAALGRDEGRGYE